MAAIDMSKIRIGVGMMGDVYIYRQGKEAGVALQKRSAEADLMNAFVQHMLHGKDAKDRVEKVIAFGPDVYKISIEPGTEADIEAE